MSKKRAKLLTGLIILGWGLVTLRLFWLSVWSVSPGATDGFAPQTKIEYGARGNIYDRNGATLVMNEKVYGLYIDSKVVPTGDTEKTARFIYEKLKPYIVAASDERGPGFSDIVRALKSNSRYYKLGVILNSDETEKLKSAKIPGIGFEMKVRRVYPEGELARELLGICGSDGSGKTGIEYAFDKYLKGRPYLLNRQRDGAGRNIPSDFYFENSVKGSDIYLTIDKNIQFIAERAASDALNETGASKVMVIVQDPSSGELLAMASKTRLKNGESDLPLKISPVSEVFEPGSTFKTFTYALTLGASAVKQDEFIFCENGKYNIYGHTIKDHEKKSYLTAREAFAYSSNIACAKISQRLSREKMIDGYRDFGFWSRTGINLPGEEKGLFPKSNDPFTSMTVSFGQGLGVTPLQLVNGYSAIANGGWLLEPQIIFKISPLNKDAGKIASIIGDTGGKKESSGSSGFSLPFISKLTDKSLYADQGDTGASTIKGKVIRRVAVRTEVLELIKDMLGDVVKYGTGRLSIVDGYRIGGKTGTAQKIDRATGEYSSRYYVASFCGILPLDNPRLTILTLVDSPTKGDYWGGTVAAPLFARVARETASYLRIPPSKDYHSDNLVLADR